MGWSCLTTSSTGWARPTRPTVATRTHPAVGTPYTWTPPSTATPPLATSLYVSPLQIILLTLTLSLSLQACVSEPPELRSSACNYGVFDNGGRDNVVRGNLCVGYESCVRIADYNLHAPAVFSFGMVRNLEPFHYRSPPFSKCAIHWRAPCAVSVVCFRFAAPAPLLLRLLFHFCPPLQLFLVSSPASLPSCRRPWPGRDGPEYLHAAHPKLLDKNTVWLQPVGC